MLVVRVIYLSPIAQNSWFKKEHPAKDPMKISEITLYELKLPLVRPYKVSHKVFHEFRPILVEVADADGRQGWGEAVISTGYSKETVNGGWAFCEEVARSFKGRDSGPLRAHLVENRHVSPNAASAILTALDMLENDNLLHISQDTTIPLLAPCQAHEPELIKAEVEQLLSEGFQTLKVKVGFNVQRDLERVSEIQHVVNGRAVIRLDANRAFTREQGCEFGSRLAPAGVQLFEQPCGSSAWEDNAAVAAVSTVPVMLDESIYGSSDIERASQIPGVRFVKLKLKKMGSCAMLRTALEHISALGMEPILGDGVATDIGCWMEACVARSTIRNAGEMNGFLKTKVSLFENPLTFENGAILLKRGYLPRINGDVLTAHMVKRMQV